MYEKEGKKGDASSLRFNERQVSIALSRSGKKSKQQLFDWLLDRYVNDESHILERQQEQYAVGIDQYRTTDIATQPAQVFQQPQQFLNKEGIYRQAIQEAETMADFKNIYSAIEKDVLHFRTKSTLYELLQAAKEKKGFIYND